MDLDLNWYIKQQEEKDLGKRNRRLARLRKRIGRVPRKAIKCRWCGQRVDVGLLMCPRCKKLFLD